jgi:hypothetical protein
MAKRQAELEKKRQAMQEQQQQVQKQEQQLIQHTRILQTPKYWPVQPHRGQVLVDVTHARKAEVQHILDTTSWGKLGQGRDQVVPGNYSRLQMELVHVVVNKPLWTKYAARQLELRAQGKGQAHRDTVATDKLPWIKDHGLSQDVNEKLLFHGTSKEVADIITQHRFDERVANLAGLFGAGIYFAESCGKSDQYTQPDRLGHDKLHWLILARVTLGNTFHHTSSHMNHIRRAPEAPGGGGRCCDAVIGAVPGMFREHIVYDRTQCYPEFVIAYSRR